MSDKQTIELTRQQWHLVRRAVREADSKMQEKIIRHLNQPKEIQEDADWKQWHEEDVQEHLDLMLVLDALYTR